MKNLILKIVLLATIFFSACDATSSEKETESPKTNAMEINKETPPSDVPTNSETVKAKPLTAPPIVDAQTYYGMYTYMADANMFTSCDKSVSTSIAMKGKYLDLERRYLTVAEGGDKVFIHFKGKMEKAPAMEGDGTEDVLMIEELLEVDKAKRCD